MGNETSAPTAQDEQRLFEAEKACRAVQVGEVTMMVDEEQQRRIDNPHSPDQVPIDLKATVLAQLIATFATRHVIAVAETERQYRIALNNHLDAMDELVRKANARRADLESELELSRRASRWFIVHPTETSNAKAECIALLRRHADIKSAIKLAELEKARRIEANLRISLHEDLERHNARTGVALATALEQTRRISEPFILRECTLHDTMANVMTDLVRKCSIRRAKEEADFERTRRVAEELKKDAHELIIRRHAISTAMREEEFELSRRCSTWFFKHPEDIVAAKNFVQEDLLRAFQVWAVRKAAQAEQQHRVAKENMHLIKESINRLGAMKASRVAEETERSERITIPRLPKDEKISRLMSEIHTSIIRAVSAKKADIVTKIEGQERSTEYYKRQFLLDIERLGNRRCAADAADEEQARRLRAPLTLQDRQTADALVEAMSAMVRYHAISSALTSMNEEQQRRIVKEKTHTVHSELMRTVNKKNAILMMESELGRRISMPDKKSEDIKAILAAVHEQVVRSCNQKFAAIQVEEERQCRITAMKFHSVKEELMRKINKTRVDSQMNIELSQKCAQWFQRREDHLIERKNVVQNELVRTVNKKLALSSSEMERVRRVVANARLSVISELSRSINRENAIQKMSEEQKRRIKTPYLPCKTIDRVLSDVQSKIISVVNVKSVIQQAEQERTERITTSLKHRAEEELLSTVSRKQNSKRAREALDEREALYKIRATNSDRARLHQTMIAAIRLRSS